MNGTRIRRPTMVLPQGPSARLPSLFTRARVIETFVVPTFSASFGAASAKPPVARRQFSDMTSSNPYESPKSRPDPAPPPTSQRNWVDYAPSFNSAMWTGIKIQTVLAVLTVLMLDFGQTHRAFGVAMLCQWATVFILLLRRPMVPTKLDLTIVRYGIVPFLFVVAGSGPILLRLLGIPNG